jgi:hypothetical protein
MPDRPLHVIGNEIAADWPGVAGFPAEEYVRAMQRLETLDDSYGADTALMAVTYFLGNANAWRGPTARRVKAELREMIKRRGF